MGQRNMSDPELVETRHARRLPDEGDMQRSISGREHLRSEVEGMADAKQIQSFVDSVSELRLSWHDATGKQLVRRARQDKKAHSLSPVSVSRSATRATAKDEQPCSRAHAMPDSLMPASLPTSVLKTREGLVDSHGLASQQDPWVSPQNQKRVNKTPGLASQQDPRVSESTDPHGLAMCADGIAADGLARSGAHTHADGLTTPSKEMHKSRSSKPRPPLSPDDIRPREPAGVRGEAHREEQASGHHEDLDQCHLPERNTKETDGTPALCKHVSSDEDEARTRRPTQRAPSPVEKEARAQVDARRVRGGADSTRMREDELKQEFADGRAGVLTPMVDKHVGFMQEHMAMKMAAVRACVQSGMDKPDELGRSSCARRISADRACGHASGAATGQSPAIEVVREQSPAIRVVRWRKHQRRPTASETVCSVANCGKVGMYEYREEGTCAGPKQSAGSTPPLICAVVCSVECKLAVLCAKKQQLEQKVASLRLRRASASDKSASRGNGKSISEQWEERRTEQGQVYYLDHSACTSHWSLPTGAA
jgi:hypothetical protein